MTDSAEAAPNQRGLNRREFLYYATLSSFGVLIAGSGVASVIYVVPRYKVGQFGGKFIVGKVEDFPDGSVTTDREGKFYLVRLGDEFRALYQVCTHLGCLLRHTEEVFACPCHGAKFALDGTLLSPPASRDMDEFAVEVVDGMVIVDTGSRTRGQSRSV